MQLRLLLLKAGYDNKLILGDQMKLMQTENKPDNTLLDKNFVCFKCNGHLTGELSLRGA